MKRVVKAKNVIAFVAVLILLFSIATVPAHANPLSYSQRQRLGAWVASALTALNITLSSGLAPYQNMLDYVPEQLGIYTPTWDNDYLDRSTIEIWKDYTIIDGVPYTDIWLSNEAAEKFRTDGFDFVTAYDLASQSNGTFASGAGYADGIPVYDLAGPGMATQSYEIPASYGTYDFGDGTITVDQGGLGIRETLTTSTGRTYSDQYGQSFYPIKNSYRFNTDTFSSPYWYRVLNNGTGQSTSVSIPMTNQPFDFDWVSGTIPADSPLPSDTGMMIRVPSQDFEPFYVEHPDFPVNQPVEIDFTLDPDIKLELDDLMDVIIPIMPVLDFDDINFIQNHEAPVPVPDVPIVDATVPQVVNPIINEITNYGDQITEQIPQIIETIPTIDSICENIDTAPYHDLDTGLDHLPSFFLPFITDLRSALGIWHYVTEWLSQISTTFAFISGCLVGTSIMTPIYAGIAGFMCIKIYRRMTS